MVMWREKKRNETKPNDIEVRSRRVMYSVQVWWWLLWRRRRLWRWRQRWTERASRVRRRIKSTKHRLEANIVRYLMRERATIIYRFFPLYEQRRAFICVNCCCCCCCEHAQLVPNKRNLQYNFQFKRCKRTRRISKWDWFTFDSRACSSSSSYTMNSHYILSSHGNRCGPCRLDWIVSLVARELKFIPKLCITNDVICSDNRDN